NDLIPTADASPGCYRIRAGLFSRKEDERLKVTSGPAGDDDSRIVIEDIVISPEKGLPALSRSINQDWSGMATLQSVDLPGGISAPAVADCQKLSDQCSNAVMLKWKVTAPQSQPFVVFIHVLDATGRLVAQNDS